MAYTDTLLTDKDKVRFHIGDTGATAILSDNEITAILASEDNYWLAAARCAEAILAKWNGQSGGLTEKQVDDLKLKWGGTGSGDAQDGYRKHIAQLRATGVRALHPASKPSILGML